MTGWRALEKIPADEMSEARLQAHFAAQWLAKAARAYIPAQDDDSHTALSWDSAQDAFFTGTLGEGAVQLGLKIAALELLILAEGAERERFALDGASDAQVKYWLGGQVSRAGFDADELEISPPWEMPAHAIADGGAYAAQNNAAALKNLTNWYANAQSVLLDLAGRHSDRHPGPSPVRCWPHHFDLATLIVLSDGDREDAQSVGVGFSPGDGSYDEPYFYVSPWPYPDSDKLPSLPSGGHWHTDGFTAAVAPASGILEVRDPQGTVHNFVTGATDAAIGLVL